VNGNCAVYNALVMAFGIGAQRLAQGSRLARVDWGSAPRGSAEGFGPTRSSAWQRS
jgi:hypothetical protein